jgi:hypothetical protein
MKISMSGESQSSVHRKPGIIRAVSPAEREILVSAICRVPNANEMLDDLNHLSAVEEMADGGMDSIMFVRPSDEQRPFGKKIVTAEFKDLDGTLVSAALNVDDRGQLMEIASLMLDGTTT